VIKDKRKIILGTKDVLPKENNDIFLNIELSSNSDELVNEIINNNFNSNQQFLQEREESLKFCIYGILDSQFIDTDNLKLTLKTNHNDVLNSPRIKDVKTSNNKIEVLSQRLSFKNSLSKNIFKKSKSSYLFMFELNPDYNNYGETKTVIIEIKDEDKGIFFEKEIAIINFDSEGNKIPYGSDTIDVNLDGEEQIVDNDFPFLFDSHWVKSNLNINKLLTVNLQTSEVDDSNSINIDESNDIITFVVKLENPSINGIEEVEVFVDNDLTIESEQNYILENGIINWDKGEQFKEVKVKVFDNNFVDDIRERNISISLKNEKNCILSNNIIYDINIKDDDVSICGFRTAIKNVEEEDVELEIFIDLDNEVSTTNQSIFVQSSQIPQSMIGSIGIVGGQFDGTFFRKKIDFIQGQNSASFFVKINKKYEYSLVKEFNLFLVEDTATNGIKVDNNKEQLTINVFNSIKTKYTKYKINNNRNLGQGIFRLSNPRLSPLTVVNFLISSSTNNIIAQGYNFKLKIINKGVNIVYNEELIGYNGVVKDISFSNGFQPFEILLPSNDVLSEIDNSFDKSKYEFVFYEIDGYDDKEVKVSTESLESSLNLINPIEYNLVSEIHNVSTRLFRQNDGTYRDAPTINNSVIDVKINGVLLLPNTFDNNLNSSSETFVKDLSFQEESIVYNELIDAPAKETYIPVKPIL
jgi:hypothetical protein